MSKPGPKELERRRLREAQKRPQERVEPSNGVSEPDAASKPPADLLYAPAGECQWCDARRTYARDHMRKLRARE